MILCVMVYNARSTTVSATKEKDTQNFADEICGVSLPPIAFHQHRIYYSAGSVCRWQVSVAVYNGALRALPATPPGIPPRAAGGEVSVSRLQKPMDSSPLAGMQRTQLRTDTLIKDFNRIPQPGERLSIPAGVFRPRLKAALFERILLTAIAVDGWSDNGAP